MPAPLTCPQCGRPVPETPGYSPWCDHCNWNLIPDPPASPSTPLEELYIQLGKLSSLGLRAEQLDGEKRRPGVSRERVLAMLLASVAYLVFALLFGAGALLLVQAWRNPFAWVAVVICWGMVWILRPRLGRYEGHLLPPAEYPALYAAVNGLVRQIRARPLANIGVEGRYNASMGRYTWRRTEILSIGLPLWTLLDPEERVALLAHEIAHRVNGDPLRGAFFGNAVHLFFGWFQFFRPERVLEYSIQSVIALPITLCMLGLARSAYWMGVTLCHLLWRDSQRAEYRADRLAASVSGVLAKTRALRKAHLSRALDLSLHHLVHARDHAPDLFQDLRERAARVPAREIERMNRITTQTTARLDTTHPPTAYRIEVLAFQKALPQTIPIPVDWGAVDQELDRLKGRLQAEMVDKYRSYLYG